MKELIAAILFFVSIYSGTVVLKAVHNTIKVAAIEKASKGLPSLTKMNRQIRTPKPQR